MVTTNIQSFSGNVEVAGTLSVTGNLISTTGVDKVDLSTDTTNALRPVIFSTGTTGSQSLKTDPGITYNPSTKTFTLTDNITASNATVSDYLIHKDNTNTYLGFPADDTIAFTTGGGEKVRITSTGNLGVGSAAPAYKLHVVGNTYVTSNLTVGTANLHVDTLTGNVGIGTTTPIFTLDVHGTSNVGALTATTVNATTFTGSMSQSLSNGSYLTGDAYDGSVARTFAVDATTDSTANKIVARDASGNVYADRLFTADYLVHEGDINTYFGFPSNDTITFTTTGDERMRVDQYGNVAIGTTSAPYKLNVAGTANVGALSATTVTFSDDLAVGTNKFFVDVSSSNVGIGTSEPAYKLDVHGTSNVGVLTGTTGTFSGAISVGSDTNTTSTLGRVKIGYNGTDDFATFSHIDRNNELDYALGQETGGTTVLNTKTGKPINFRVNNANKMTMDLDGKFGIGTVTPDANLDVVGNVYVSSNLTVGTSDFHVDTVTGFVGVGTTNPEYTLDVAGTSRLGVVALTPKTYLYSNVHNIEYPSDVASDFEQVLLQFDTGGTDSFDQSEYAGYIDVEMVAQRTRINYFGPEIFTARVNYIVGWNEADDLWRFTTFVQENKSVSGYVPDAYTVFKSVPVFKYRYIDRQLQIYVSFNADLFRGYTSFTARVTSDAPTDVSMPGPDTLMASGTEGTAEVGMCYGVGDKAAYVGIGTTNPTSNLHVVGNAYVSSDLTVGASKLFVDASTGQVGVGSASPTSNLHVVGNAYVSSNLTVGTANLHVDTTTGFVGVGTTNPEYTLDVAGSAVFNTYMQVAREINRVSSGDDVVLLLTPSADGNKMSGTICGIDSLYSSRFRSGTVKLEVIVNTNSQSGGHPQETFSFIKHAVINAASTYYTPVTCDYNGKNWFAIRIQGSEEEDPWYSWFSGLLQHNGGDDTLSIVYNDGVNVTNVVTFTNKQGIQHTEFSNQNLVVSYGNVGIGTTNPTSNLHVVGDINLTSNIVMSGEVFIKAHDATSNHVAIGPGAGQTSQGTNAVAVGYLAGQTNQHDNTVVLNASGSALNTEGTGRTYIKPLRVATVASNVMTYDQTTGEVMDSGGLFTNRLAVVSEQPPSALTGATTTIQGHGKYVVTSSATTSGGLADWNIFNKVSGNGDGDAWSTGSAGTYYDGNGTHIGDGTLGGVDGEWLKLEMPYKTKLRHVSLAPRSTSHYAYMPEAFTILGSNDDSSWTTLKALTGQTWTSPNDVKYVIDASASYKYYAIVVEETNGNFATIGEWRLFTESFSVDGGIVTTTAASGLETGFTEHPVQTLRGSSTYNANIGSAGEFPPTTHYVEGHGTYEVWASSQYNASGQATREAWKLFDGASDTYWGTSLSSSTESYNTSSPYEYTGLRNSTTVDVGGTRYKGAWVQIKVPYAITLAHTDVYRTVGNYGRAPTSGVILGSNDGEAWYKLTEFSDASYASGDKERVDVSATTPYQYYRLAVTNVAGDSSVLFSQWRLFSATGVTKMDNVLISGELAVHGGALQTSHIKWPKVPLKAAESEGYVASSSTNYNAGLSNEYKPWYAFNALPEYGSDWTPSWGSNTNTFTSGTAATSRTTGSDTFNHEWIQIQLPRPIKLSFFKIKGTIGSHAGGYSPKSGRLYASNDAVSWTKIVSFSDLTFASSDDWAVVDTHTTSKYTHFRWAITESQGSGTIVQIEELQLFESTLGVGTSATTAKLTVDGGLGLAKGSQVFAGSDVITEFPKHDRPLTKYPEVLFMEGEFEGNDSTNTYTQAGYTVTANSTHENRNHEPWKIFDGTQGNEWQISTQQGGDRYSESTGTYNTGVDLAGVTLADQTYNGDWVQVSLPKKIKVDHMNLGTPVAYGDSRMPEEGVLLGSNNGSNWSNVASFGQTSYPDGSFTRININSAEYYSYYRMIWLKLTAGDDSTHRDRAALSEWELYGTEEGDESVDIVHRSIPNKPSQQQLAVYYEARDPNSYSFADSTKVYDLSGSGVTGTVSGVGYRRRGQCVHV
jgi:hypothetical protein